MDLVELKKVQPGNFHRHPWELARLDILKYLIRKNNINTGYILDVGSGDAFVATEIFKEYKGSVIAVDSNYTEEFLQHEKKPGLTFKRKLDGVNEKRIDLVLLMDVLEHVEQQGNLLASIRNLPGVSASTIFFITVPAYQSLFTDHDVFLGHYRRYNIKSLEVECRSAGLEVKQAGYFFMSLLLPRLVQKYFRLGSKHALHDWNGGAFTTGLVRSILWTDFKISWYLSKLGIRLPGLSCYCLCNPLPS